MFICVVLDSLEGLKVVEYFGVMGENFIVVMFFFVVYKYESCYV